MRTTKDPETRRAELISAARELFDKNGIKNTQVSQIVSKVGVAQGLFYYYFKSKDAVVDEVMKTVTEELNTSAEQIVHSRDMDFYGKISAYIKLYIRMIDQFSGDDEQNLRNMFEAIGKNPIAKQANELMLIHLEALVEQGCEQGILQMRYPNDMARMTLYGLLLLTRDSLISQEQLAAMVEQGLGLPQDSIKLN